MSDLNLSQEGGIARVVFDRRGALNSFTPQLLKDLIGICADLSSQAALKVVTFEGAGNCFSAGADLPTFLPLLAGPEAQATADLGRLATNAIAELPQITVAAVRGHCVGGGVVFAGACDLRIAADDARFLIPELDAGIPLGWGGLDHLVRLVGETVAADLVLSSRPFGAEEALRAGLISRIVAAGELQDELASLVAAIARKPLGVLRITKRQLIKIRGRTFDAREDAGSLLTSLKDPEALEVGQRYLMGRMKRNEPRSS